MKQYQPLIDTPHLFLEFARITESRDRNRALEQWISRYGLLGLHKARPRSFRDGLPEVADLQFEGVIGADGEPTSGDYSKTVGPDEVSSTIQDEVSIANDVLVLYEAALSRDEDKLEPALIRGGTSSIEDLREYCRVKAELAGGASNTEVLVHLATQQAFWRVQEVLEQFHLSLHCCRSTAPDQR